MGTARVPVGSSHETRDLMCFESASSAGTVDDDIECVAWAKMRERRCDN